MARQTKTYYLLPTDGYGQPDGRIEEIQLTPEQYNERKRFEWIFDNYYSALCRSQD